MILVWRGALLPSGGKLRPEKCYWYAIYYIWANGLWSYGTTIDLEIILPNDDGQNVSIKQLPVTKAMEVVSVWVRPDGNCLRQKEKLIGKTTTFTARLNDKYIDKNLLWMGVQQILYPTISYCLPATSFSQSDCAEIMHPVKKFIIPKLGLNAKFPHAILYAPIKFGGRNFPNLYWEQGISHIDTWLAHCSALTITGKLLLVELDNLQLEIGEFDSVFNLSYDQYSY